MRSSWSLSVKRWYVPRLRRSRSGSLRYFLDFFRGTFAPASRASLRPIAIACLRLVTFLPDPPDRSVPRLRSCIARSTLSEAFFPYFVAITTSGRSECKRHAPDVPRRAGSSQYGHDRLEHAHQRTIAPALFSFAVEHVERLRSSQRVAVRPFGCEGVIHVHDADDLRQ